MDYNDFDEMFANKYKAEFERSNNIAEFAAAIGGKYGEYIATYGNELGGGWADQLFATRKVGKHTYRPLVFPNVNKFSELFDAAILRSTEPSTRYNDEFLYASGGVCGHFGGKRGWSKTSPEIRSHYGAKFFGTYVKPNDAVMSVHMTFPSRKYSFEFVKRDDGILVIMHDDKYIGKQWLALLPLSESIESMFDADTVKMLASERKAELEAWPEKAGA